MSQQVMCGASLSWDPAGVIDGPTPLLELIESIYATVHEPQRWPGVMQGIAQALQGESIALFTTFPGCSTPEILALHGLPVDNWQSFANYYADFSFIRAACQRKSRPNETWFSDRAVPSIEFERSERYAALCRHSQPHYFVGMQIVLPDLPTFNLTCQRHVSMGPFDERADLICQMLRPHLQRALQLYYSFSSAQAHSESAIAALDCYGHAVLSLDGNSCIVTLNRHAESLLRQSQVLLIKHRRLVAASSAIDVALQNLLEETAGARPSTSAGGALSIPQPAEAPPLSLTATPFHAPAIFGTSCIAALVFIVDPSTEPMSRAVVLKSLFRVTPIEVRVANFLLSGLSVREIAGCLNVGEETTRFYIKQLLRKTSTSRQSDLVRLLLSLPGS